MALITVIVAYDVSDDDRRARLAALLQSVGDRIQKSVFLLQIEPDDLDHLMTTSAGLIAADTDSIYAIRNCAACWSRIQLLGQATPPGKELFWAAL